MSYSCDYEPEPGDKYYLVGNNKLTSAPKGRRKRCVSCGELIDSNELCLKHERRKVPFTEVECKIYGEDGEIPIAPHYHCKKCGEIYIYLIKNRKCVPIYENMEHLKRDIEEGKQNV